jgi:mannose-6-phosphate isomerase-like protein (cupin superfamily)
MIEVIDLAQKFDLFAEQWKPKIVGELNEGYVKLAKVQGEFVWHKHEAEDELFLVLAGTLVIRLRDRELTLHPGQLVIIPKGVEHQPFAEEEAQLLLLEPKSTLNTGDVRNERTVEADWI